MNVCRARERRVVLLLVVLLSAATAQEQGPTPTASPAPEAELEPFPSGTLTYGEIVETAFTRCSILPEYFSSNVLEAATFTALITRALNSTIPRPPPGQILISLAPTKDAFAALFSSDNLTLRDAVGDVDIAEAVLAYSWALVENPAATSALRPSVSSNSSVEFLVDGKPASLTDVTAAAENGGNATVVEKDTGRQAKVVSSAACPETGIFILGMDTAFAPEEYTKLSVPLPAKDSSTELLPISPIFPMKVPPPRVSSAAGAPSHDTLTKYAVLGALASILATLFL